MTEWVTSLMGARNTFSKVFIIVKGLTEHKSHLVLMINKQYLLSTKPLTTECDLRHGTFLGGVSRKIGRTIWAQDGVHYANSHTWVHNFFSPYRD